jgi:hypothetical protein
MKVLGLLTETVADGAASDATLALGAIEEVFNLPDTRAQVRCRLKTILVTFHYKYS